MTGSDRASDGRGWSHAVAMGDIVVDIDNNNSGR